MLTQTLATLLQAPTDGGPLAAAADIAIIVIAVAVVVLAVLGGVVLIRFNVIMTELRRSARQSFGPVSDRARSISDNVEFITQALRTDVEKLNASVRALSDRLQQASDRMEERIEEFNALMSVVQDEAEDIFLDTASTVRGVREGARVISRESLRAGDGEPVERPAPHAEAAPHADAAPHAEAEPHTDAAPHTEPEEAAPGAED